MRNPMQKVRAAAAIAATIAIFGGALPSLAEHTRFWRQSRYEEFEKGTAHGVAIRSDGRLFLAPSFAPLGDADLAYLWALRADSKGTLYAAGGSNAKVVKFDAHGKAIKVFESQEMSAQALAIDAHDNLYVGTSPDGKVYKVTPAGQSSVFFDPKTKYIWALEFGPDGTLYVATGDTGKIFSVTPDGKGEVFYASNEIHVRALAFDGKGNLLAGTEPNGRILRIPLAAPGASNSGGRRAFVLYETDKKEVTALKVDPDGNLYVAAIGEKPRGQQPLGPAVVPQQQPPTTATLTFSSNEGGQVDQQQQQLQVQPQVQIQTFVPFPTLTSSAVFRIAPDGSPQQVWSSREELVYSLGWSAKGNLLLGTGNHGSILQLDASRIFSQIEKTASEQVTALTVGANGKIYVATANPGKVFALGPGDEAQGTFESQAFDARIFSRWGRLSWWGEGQDVKATGSARIEMFARSGNTASPDENWSPWAGPYTQGTGETVDCPPARFVQWKAVLHDAPAQAGSSEPLPQVEWVDLAYLPKNVAPVIGAIVVQEPGVRVQGISVGAGQAAQGPVPVQLHLPNAPSTQTLGFESGGGGGGQGLGRFEAPPQGFRLKGYQAVLWSATDENEDTLEFSIFYRGEGESNWKLLKDKIEERFFSWDTSTMPDGAYYLKIVASDEPSNPPDLALTAERESDRFLVDNTPPTIGSLTAKPDPKSGPGVARAHFEASDVGSAIARAQYSLDAGDWTLVLPTGGLSDSQQEAYDLALTDLAPGEHTLAVRVYDQFENATSAKVTFRVGPENR
ncbi:MAG: hypothetical protein ACLP1Y_05910 [Candidatus Acidiferrales bacterium]